MGQRVRVVTVVTNLSPPLEDKPIPHTYKIANKHLAVCLPEVSYIAGRKKNIRPRLNTGIYL